MVRRHDSDPSRAAPLPPERWARVEALFAQALERPAGERETFLDAACGDDEALRREVASLLAVADTEMTDRLSAVDRVAEDLLASAGSAAVGRRIGPWQLEEEIGRGGMGVVYRATRADGAYEQTVAVKVLPGALFNPGSLARFRTERRILAGLEHPNIARLLDGGTTSEGVPYVVMEMVDGRPLDRYARERELDLEDRVWLLLAVCDAVEYAHRSLVVHRDLKPSNILVTEDGVPKLLDFGIATLLAPDAEDHEATGTGTRIMTPRFASPEQILGERVGTPTDVYSLGLVLYRLLAGTDPWEDAGGTGPASGGAEAAPGGALIQRALQDRVRPPSQASGDRRLRGDLDTVVLEALRRDPEDRYPSVAALADDLRRWLTGRPVAARAPTPWYRARKFVRRHRAAVLGTAAAVLLLVAQTGLFLDRLARERDTAREEAARATRTLEFLTGLFEGADPFQSADPDLTARALLGRGAARLDEELADQPGIRAEILSAVGGAYAGLGVPDSARALMERSLELREATYGPSSLETARGQAHLAGQLNNMDAGDAADSLLAKSLEIRRARLPADHPDLAATLSLMARRAHRRGDRPTADSLYREAADILDRASEPREELRTSLLYDHGVLLMEMDRLDEAEASLNEALARREARYGPRNPQVAMVRAQIARLKEIAGDLAGSEALHREMIAWGEEMLGPDHPFVTTWYNNLASVVRGQGRNEEALAIQEQVVERQRRQYGDTHSLVASALNNLANMYGNVGRFEEAEEAFLEARAIVRELFGADHPLMATTLNNMATLAWRQGDYGRAATLQEEVLRVDRRQLGPRHEYVATDLMNLGSYRLLEGRVDEAGRHLADAVALLHDIRGRDNLNTAAAESSYADWLVAVGRGPEAVELAREALETRLAHLDEETAAVGYGRSTLGAALALTGDHEAAEEQLLAARSILARTVPEGDPNQLENEKRLEALYRVWGAPGRGGSRSP